MGTSYIAALPTPSPAHQFICLPHELACTSPAWPSIAPSPIALVFILPGSVGRGSCRLALVLLARVLVLISLRLADSHEPPS